MASSRETVGQVRSKRSLAPPWRAVLLWLTALKPPKIDTSADRFYDPALATHGIYFRGKAIRTLSNGLVTRNHWAGSVETILGAALEAGGRFCCGELH